MARKTTQTTGAGGPDSEEQQPLAKRLKDNFEAIDQLRNRRRELVSQLSQDGLREDLSSELANELAGVCRTILHLTEGRQDMYTG